MHSLMTVVTASLKVHRPMLLQGAETPWFRVTHGGTRLRQRGIEGAVRRATLERLGKALGTRCFRHSAATLGASPAVVQARPRVLHARIATPPSGGSC